MMAFNFINILGVRQQSNVKARATTNTLTKRKLFYPMDNNYFNLPEAPTFYPTAEEFKDPYGFIESIKTIGEKSGIIKIVPPKGY